MTEAVISSLAQVRALKVTSRTSVMRYKGSNKSLPEIAQELNVDAIVEGSVQREGNHVRITAQLIRADSDTHLWAKSYERELSDALKLQGEIARAIAAEIRVQVTPQEQARLASGRQVNPEAYEAYLRGRFHMARTNEQDLAQAIAELDRAIQLDPNFAAAYAALSSAWRERGVWGAMPFRGVKAQAREAAQKALQLDDNLAEAHTSLAALKYLWDWDWKTAERELQRALDLDPNSVDAHSHYAFFLHALGRYPEAIAAIQRAQELAPTDSLVESGFGRILYRAREYDQAVTHLQRAIELDAGN